MPTPSVFPVNSSNPLQHGITKREMFAAMAMQALLARKDQSMPPYFIAEMAVKYADELLEALESKRQ